MVRKLDDYPKFSWKEHYANRFSIQLLLLLVVVFFLLTSCDAQTTNYLATDSDASHLNDAADNTDNNNNIDNSDSSDIIDSVVSTAFELHLNEYDMCRVDIKLPNLNINLPNANQFNEIINSEFSYILAMKDIEDCQTAEGYDYVWYQYDYTVADFDGIYSIAIYSNISSAYGSYSPMRHVRSFYYDKKNGNILSVEQFIDMIGYSKDDIIKAYINSCCPALTPEQIDFNQIYFYFDEHKELNFFFNLSSIIMP